MRDGVPESRFTRAATSRVAKTLPQKGRNQLPRFRRAPILASRRNCFLIKAWAICSSCVWPATVDRLGLQSLEYATDHLGVETIVVLGHQNCGAVKGAVASFPAAAPEFLSLIYPAIRKAEALRQGAGSSAERETLCREAGDQHVIGEVAKIQATYPFNEMIERGKLKVVGGRYDLDTGSITMLIEANAFSCRVWHLVSIASVGVGGFPCAQIFTHHPIRGQDMLC